MGGVVVALSLAVVAVNAPPVSQAFTVMDAPWLVVARERSQFLFLQLWSIHDWAINAQPFVSLGFTAIAVADERIRKLCAGAALVGAAGLAVAFIGGVLCPIPLFAQGEGSRWV